MRTANIARKTKETDIKLELNLDGTGAFSGTTSVGFFDHMLELMARHALFDLTVNCVGDTHVDDHHTVEDVGIALGQALTAALGDKRGITRYGSCHLPMDECLVLCALDISGRPLLVWDLPVRFARMGTFEGELCEEFFRALCLHGGLNLHVKTITPGNAHHLAEAAFKGTARALRQAVTVDRREPGVPSTKGLL